MPGGVFPLLNLPPEILLELCHALVPCGPYLTFSVYEKASQGFVDLCQLARTCKTLSRIVRTFFRNPLYRESRPFIGILPYALNILRDPELAHYETTLRMVSSNTDGSIGQGDVETFKQASRDLLGSPFCRATLSYLQGDKSRHYSKFDIYRARSDLTYILLVKLPNLTSITLDYALWTRRTTPKPLNLPFLKQARFIGTNLRTPENHLVATDLFFFRLHTNAAPNLEILEVERMHKCTGPLVLQNVRTLRIINSYMGVEDLDRLLGSRELCLESFTYKTGLYENYIRIRGAIRAEELFPNEIVKSLENSPSRTRLHTLKLDLRERGDFSNKPSDMKSLPHWYDFNRHNAVSHFISTLDCFPSLRDITLTQQCLWEPYYNWATGFKKDKTPRAPSRLISLLSKSVETFTLVDITLEFFPAIISLAEVVNSKQQFSHLKRVRLHPHPNLIKRYTHAKAHADDPSLPKGNSRDIDCTADSQIQPQMEMIIRLFQQVGVDARFPLRVYPIPTDNQVHLERQRELGHWCRKCHFHPNHYFPKYKTLVQQPAQCTGYMLTRVHDHGRSEVAKESGCVYEKSSHPKNYFR
ncbi:uncharacterized protein GGS22DRAFT_185162 [Annulohypoxylon maeteangense]|uniref:uncharacterized protein n=1 Tax=Annulohypoxylon maeteangense TaxID=1927788 RepID=UPI002008157D|nr:uncharacterized protein GGS22DRAFT_185162 [Annulohypoxylon maeteangense]KAI0887783.1 hypothetical protein GGS22DRAFT_185162 [Annulohypoxylon maeteangense]